MLTRAGHLVDVVGEAFEDSPGASKHWPFTTEKVVPSLAPFLNSSQASESPPVARTVTHRASPSDDRIDPTIASALPDWPFFLICTSAITPSTSPTAGKQHRTPSTREATARPLTDDGRALGL